MGYRNISADMKQRALQLIDEGWEMAEVAEVLNVFSKSIRPTTTRLMDVLIPHLLFEDDHKL
jgi:hypothetical protein